MEVEALTDEALCERARGGDVAATEQLIHRCRGLILRACRPYFLTGGDYEDLMQEGMIGLFKSIQSYNGKSPFKSFAYLCIRRNICSAIRCATRDKNKPLNNRVSLAGAFAEAEEGETAVLGNAVDPETLYINRESERELKARITGILSRMENSILQYYLDGYSYREIADKMGKEEKSIDNALQRIRRKIERSVK